MEDKKINQPEGFDLDQFIHKNNLGMNLVILCIRSKLYLIKPYSSPH